MADHKGKPPPTSPDRASEPAPHQTPRTREQKAARHARLAAEMHENLLKRKHQQRARRDRKPPDA